MSPLHGRVRARIFKGLLQAKNEVKVLNSLNHPNIVKYYECYQERNMMHIIMELCEVGPLCLACTRQCSSPCEQEARLSCQEGSAFPTSACQLQHLLVQLMHAASMCCPGTSWPHLPALDQACCCWPECVCSHGTEYRYSQPEPRCKCCLLARAG